MKIFTSYRSINRVLVNQLVTDLQDMGHEVWYDQELSGGQHWWNSILSNIRECDLLVFALTPHSVESVPCQKELSYANALRKAILPVEIVKIDNISLLPHVLQERHIVSYLERNIEAYKKLEGAIRKLPPTSPLPDPLPEPPSVPISPLASVREQIDSPNLPVEQQAAIVHTLKSYLYNDEYDSQARELLDRLSQHNMLYASVLKEIQTAQMMPRPAQTSAASEAMSQEIDNLFNSSPPPPSPSQNIPSPIPSPPPPPSFTPADGENVLREVDVSFMGGSLVGLASGLFTYGLTTAATAAARKVMQRKLVITQRRLIFLPSVSDTKTIEIPMNQIAEIKKAFKMADPVIMIKTRAGEELKFSLVAVSGVGFGNREQVIELIQQFMKK